MRIRREISAPSINDQDHKIAELAHALAHPLRVALVRYLSKKNNGKGVDNVTCNKDLVKVFDYSQSTISQHVKILKACGLFITESKDKFTFYQLNESLLSEFSATIQALTRREN